MFMNHDCVKCGTHGALFATPRTFVACPQCLPGRITALRLSGADLPDWLLYLEKAAGREVRAQAKRAEAALSVSFDDLYRCATCSKMIPAKDARYYIDPETHSSPPYCVACYDRMRQT